MYLVFKNIIIKMLFGKKLFDKQWHILPCGGHLFFFFLTQIRYGRSMEEETKAKWRKKEKGLLNGEGAQRATFTKSRPPSAILNSWSPLSLN